MSKKDKLQSVKKSKHSKKKKEKNNLRKLVFMQVTYITSTKMLGTRCFKPIKILVQNLVKKMIKFIRLDKQLREHNWLKKRSKEKIKTMRWPVKINKLDHFKP